MKDIQDAKDETEIKVEDRIDDEIPQKELSQKS